MEILALLIIVYALKHAITDTKGAAKKSHEAYLKSADKRFPGMPKGKRAAHAARHDLGWGLSQLGHGFPASRHGFAQGWHESRQAHVQAMTEAKRAKTEHLEAKAGAVPQLREYQTRRQAALEQIRSGKASGMRGWLVTGMPEPKEGTPPEEKGTPEGSSSPPATYSYGSIHRPLSWPTDDLETARQQAAAMSHEKPQQVHRYNGTGGGELLETYVNGKLVTPEEGRELDEQYAAERDAARREYVDRGVFGAPASPGDTTVTEDHWDDPLPGEALSSQCANCSAPATAYGLCSDCRRDREGGEEGSATPEEGTPEGTSSTAPDTSPTSTASTEGTTMAGDTSYNEIDTGLTEDHDTAETAAAEHQQAAAQQEQAADQARSALAKTNAMIDAASALKLDSSTVSELMEHAEAQKGASERSDAAHEALMAAMAAHQRVMETSTGGQTTLRANHGQYQQAHDDSPVDSADSEFYAA
jgi:hypothetical protein